mmetsp:Transcript_14501/g.40343  ORF Transcript_14501/g.40343 Transcript_14501/m.40343 type:complete len:203 (-) Transcript_14501:1149-1757(-)
MLGQSVPPNASSPGIGDHLADYLESRSPSLWNGDNVGGQSVPVAPHRMGFRRGQRLGCNGERPGCDCSRRDGVLNIISVVLEGNCHRRRRSNVPGWSWIGVTGCFGIVGLVLFFCDRHVPRPPTDSYQGAGLVIGRATTLALQVDSENMMDQDRLALVRIVRHWSLPRQRQMYRPPWKVLESLVTERRNCRLGALVQAPTGS